MKNTNSETIGKRIAEIRRANHMTQEKLAEHLSVSPKHASHVERGESCYSIKNLIEFCELFDCSLDYIVFGKASNSILEKLPEDITNILYTSNSKELDRLNRYLQMYLELTQQQN